MGRMDGQMDNQKSYLSLAIVITCRRKIKYKKLTVDFLGVRMCSALCSVEIKRAEQWFKIMFTNTIITSSYSVLSCIDLYMHINKIIASL